MPLGDIDDILGTVAKHLPRNLLNEQHLTATIEDAAKFTFFESLLYYTHSTNPQSTVTQFTLGMIYFECRQYSESDKIFGQLARLVENNIITSRRLMSNSMRNIEITGLPDNEQHIITICTDILANFPVEVGKLRKHKLIVQIILSYLGIKDVKVEAEVAALAKKSKVLRKLFIDSYQYQCCEDTLHAIEQKLFMDDE